MKDLRARLRLYVITDRRLAGGRPEEEVVRAAAAGGATAIQLRGKEMGGRQLYQVGTVLRRLAKELDLLFIVNDRVDVALAVEADGVHLGQDDLPLAEARRLLGRKMVIGISVDTVEEALAAQRGGADYLGAGPVFPTTSKTDAGPVMGPDGLQRICAAVCIPVVGIGGVSVYNARQVMEAGAAGLAVMSAIVSAPDVAAAASALRAAIS
ncbi:MAG TPA: thiamine phosphate synthase [Firmicutes bacterium]|nr:thiamine phosphate synthase [Bacillota bacterium]